MVESPLSMVAPRTTFEPTADFTIPVEEQRGSVYLQGSQLEMYTSADGNHLGFVATRLALGADVSRSARPVQNDGAIPERAIVLGKYIERNFGDTSRLNPLARVLGVRVLREGSDLPGEALRYAAILPNAAYANEQYRKLDILDRRFEQMDTTHLSSAQIREFSQQGIFPLATIGFDQISSRLRPLFASLASPVQMEIMKRQWGERNTTYGNLLTQVGSAATELATGPRIFALDNLASTADALRGRKVRGNDKAHIMRALRLAGNYSEEFADAATSEVIRDLTEWRDVITTRAKNLEQSQ